jgi:hypothetical protein
LFDPQSKIRNPNSKEGGNMPRRQKDAELARRRKRRAKRKKLRAKGLLPPPESVKVETKAEVTKEVVKRKPEKAPPKETPSEAPKAEEPKEGTEPPAPES